MKEKYTFEKYKSHVEGLIRENYGNISTIKTLYARLKELEKPISKKLLTDNQIYNLFNKCKQDNYISGFYYDLFCMRIVCFNSLYKNHFDNVLKEADDNFIKKIAERIEY